MRLNKPLLNIGSTFITRMGSDTAFSIAFSSIFSSLMYSSTGWTYLPMCSTFCCFPVSLFFPS